MNREADRTVDDPDFLALSEHLTGEPALDGRLAAAFRQRLNAAYPADLGRLLDAWRVAAASPDPTTNLQAAFDGDPALALAARATITVWYTGQFARPDESTDPAATSAQWRSGLIWSVIQAHPGSAAPQPPQPSGYGYWTQHP
ncbi:sugar dehydrogenase complex small subunit [Streptomyces sp. NRRL S-350]|uniref:sugar dehydrogenase complex small subunit n=1 Tax=Streptomyces sp. NRRL S-350 TaxID=1463902 RepID=UPI0004C0CF6E|nr:sugar dehydrogenase complex small subunit [Streptomyces sp. NRRL S-350]